MMKQMRSAWWNRSLTSSLGSIGNTKDWKQDHCMLETHSDYTIDNSGRMPQALMLFGKDEVTPTGYCLMQGDKKISEGLFPSDIHNGVERYNFLQMVEGEARQQWMKGPKNSGNAESSQLNVRIRNATDAFRKYFEEVVESLSPATWQAMT